MLGVILLLTFGSIHIYIFFALRHSRSCKVAFAKDGWGFPIEGMGAATAGGVVSPSSGSGSNSVFTYFTCFIHDFQYSIVSLRACLTSLLLFVHNYSVTMHECVSKLHAHILIYSNSLVVYVNLKQWYR